AQHYEQAGKADDAAAVWDRLAREAKDADAILASIDRAAGAGDFKRAATLARPQWARRPDDWRFGSRLADAYAGLNQDDDARAIHQAIVALPPNDSYARPARPPARSASSALMAAAMGMPTPGPSTFWDLTTLLSEVRAIAQGNVALPPGFPRPRPESLE